MTIEELLEYDLKEWSALSLPQLEATLAPFFKVTRPIQGKSQPKGMLKVPGRNLSAAAEARKLVEQIRDEMAVKPGAVESLLTQIYQDQYVLRQEVKKKKESPNGSSNEK